MESIVILSNDKKQCTEMYQLLKPCQGLFRAQGSEQSMHGSMQAFGDGG